MGDTTSVRIDHDVLDAPRLRRADHLRNLWVDRGFPARELNYLGFPFRLYETIKDELNLAQGQAEACSSVGKA